MGMSVHSAMRGEVAIGLRAAAALLLACSSGGDTRAETTSAPGDGDRVAADPSAAEASATPPQASAQGGTDASAPAAPVAQPSPQAGAGGTGASGTGAAGGSGSPASDRFFAWVPCPTVQPMDGSPCDLASPQECEYGEHPSPSCNAIARCQYNEAQGRQSATWRVALPSDGCEASPTNAPTCPAAVDDIAEGNACPELDLVCAYDTGACACLMQYQGNNLGAVQWVCELRAPACPAKRPALGSACPDAFGEEFQTCDYGMCFDGRLQQGCTAGRYWQRSPKVCDVIPINPGG